MINQSHKLSGPFLIDLKNRFRQIAGSDNKIDRKEFENGLLINDAQVINRIFDIFDTDQNNFLDVGEFIDGIEKLINGTNYEKIKFAFKIHDIDGSGDIDKPELEILVKNILIENNLDFDTNQIALIVSDLFNKADIDGNGKIDFDEFLKLVEEYPDFLKSLAVNPLSWFYEKEKSKHIDVAKKQTSIGKVQVQGLGLVQWLLVPRLIYLFNIIVKRNSNNKPFPINSLKVLPEKNISFSFEKPKWLKSNPGDYVYVNCPWVSKFQWYPFNLMPSMDNNIAFLNVKASGVWSEKLYDKTLAILNETNIEKLKIRIDGPYGSSSDKILNSKNIFLIAAGAGIAKFASILQDIAFRTKDNVIKSNLESVHFIWLCDDTFYVEWFKKLLRELNDEYEAIKFNYDIYFTNRNAASLPQDMLYISKDVIENKYDIDLLDGIGKNNHIGTPIWYDNFKSLLNDELAEEFSIFYSGPKNLAPKMKSAAKKLKIKFYNNTI